MIAFTLSAAIFVAVGLLPSTASAYNGILACWFNENGQPTGADSESGVVGRLKRISESGDYTYAYYIDPNANCPTSIEPPSPAPAIGTEVWPEGGDVNYDSPEWSLYSGSAESSLQANVSSQQSMQTQIEENSLQLSSSSLYQGLSIMFYFSGFFEFPARCGESGDAQYHNRRGFSDWARWPRFSNLE